MRNACTAIAFITASLVNTEMIGDAPARNMMETSPMNIALYFAVIITDATARSGCFAPRFWPTSVAAALLNPDCS